MAVHAKDITLDNFLQQIKLHKTWYQDSQLKPSLGKLRLVEFETEMRAAI